MLPALFTCLADIAPPEAESVGIPVLGIAAMLLVLVGVVLWGWSLVHAIRNPRLTDNLRIIWVLVILLTGFVGSLIYVLFGREGSPDGA